MKFTANLAKKCSVVLVILIFVSLCLPAFAETIPNGAIWISPNGDNTWSAMHFTTRSANENAILVFPSEEYDNTYTTNNGQLFQEIESNVFVLVEELSLPLSEYSSYETLKLMEAPDEMLRDIAAMAAYEEAKGNENSEIIVLAPNAPTRSGGYSTISHDFGHWNGKDFYNYQIIFTSLSTKWEDIVTGNQTTEAAVKAIEELVMIVGSDLVGDAAPLFDIAQTLHDYFVEVTGQTPIYGSTENYTQARITYNVRLKYTYYYNESTGKEMFGYRSPRVDVTQIETTNYYLTNYGGRTVNNVEYPNKQYYSPDWDNAMELAYKNRFLGVYGEDIVGRIYNHPIYFTYPDFDIPSDWPDL